MFKPEPKSDVNRTRPVLLYVGRISKEKNLEEFLELDMRASKILVGDGPMLSRYREKYPDAVFIGWVRQGQLATYYANSDVFVFPSTFDTLGIVQLEAMACGCPVAALPSQSSGVITVGVNGHVDKDLLVAVGRCLELNRKEVARSVSKMTWEHSALQFLDNLTEVKKRCHV